MTTKIQLHDVQAHILRGAKPSAAVYLALTIINVPVFLSLLERIKPFLHSEARVRDSRKREHAMDLPEPFLANVGFSFSGLKKLGLHESVLGAFPLPFQQGMAARAAFIGDAGSDAPEHWQGSWGHPSVHAFVALYFLPDQLPQDQRDTQSTPREQLDSLLTTLRVSVPAESGALVLEKEYAQVLRQGGRAIEHFGFKDGISQPWVNDGLTPILGGGRKNPGEEHWQALATGEFLLGYPDELSRIIQQGEPEEANSPLPVPTQPQAKAYFNLTRNGTFLVYRKIEQNVAKFRAQVVEKHGTEIAELMVGRRIDGAPLDADSQLASRKYNDFDFRKDIDGRGCPFGSHIRRSNPRTSLDPTGTRGTRDVDQHRLIRRGMPYGPWLEEGKADQAPTERGLHFLCYNTNLETQFEFVQKNWINNSDFIGCPAAMVDPIVGSFAHAPLGQFVAPVLDLPIMDLVSVTRIRGGEYFFVPGLQGLESIVAISRVTVPDLEKPLMDDAPPVDPFDASRILGRAQLLRNTTYTTLPVTLADGGTSLYHYFAHPLDVQQILTKPELFGNQHYRKRISALTGDDMLLSMPPGEERTQLKREMAAVLLPDDRGSGDIDAAVKRAIYPTLREQLQRFAQQGSLDLVEGLARKIPLAVVKNYLGIVAPDTFPSSTEIAHYFDRTGVDSLPAEWRMHFRNYGMQPSADATLLFWIRMQFLEVFGNLWNVPHITELAHHAGSEFAAHLVRCVDTAFAHPGDGTVLARLVHFYSAQAGLSDTEKKSKVRQRILEFVVGSTDTTMKAIANVVTVLLQKAPTLEAALMGILQTPDYQSNLPTVMAYIQGDVTKESAVNALLDSIAMKILKAYPVAPLLVRDCQFGANLKLANGQIADVAPGGTVCVVLQAASALTMLQPASASLPEFVFLDPWSAHGCMGKSIALLEVREVLKGLLTLKQVRTAAGARGVMIEKYRLPAYQLLRCGRG